MRFSKSLALLAAQSSVTVAQTNSTNSTTVPYLPLSADDHFSFILYEALSLANGGGSSTGEVMRATAKIVAGDTESFYNEFKFLGDSVHDIAESINATKFPVSAREAYFRASSYYRLSVFYMTANQSDPRLYSVWDSALADFDKAISLTEVRGERMTIKGPGFDIPIIYWKSPKAAGCGPVPTVLVGSGYDAPQEDTYHSIGREIIDRGWNFVTYEGPGQPTVRRQQGLGFIPNWWDVVTPVVDYLETRPEVDKKRIALGGLSFGGILAPLAATREHRFAAVLAIDGVQNLQTTALKQFPPALAQLYNSGNKTVFDAYLNKARVNPEANTMFKWFIGQGLWSFATESPYDWFTRLGGINLDGTVLSNITSPVFVGKGEDDKVAGGQEEVVAKLLGDKAYLYEFKTALGAGEHCQLGAEQQLAQVSLDWLAEVFEAVK
ncbi:alpha/beta-hydrolase [Annulohypoxylon maeteangense]|uniref:alpha/beta-hydrolase n=1 Tax=Annulohypoxylon maeteangense TaxID=1927788 RepID=UPI0020087821|nr:alpha/beta-hydrolase [Annulohypoxylon maeteangense]KAI0888169.1 alpha/beta-hydrolase [Annulohypoxylon maeteangense]